MNSELVVAKKLLEQGDVIAIPTETVYGLAANAFNQEAVSKIYAIKERPLFNPLIVHIKASSYLETIAQNIPPKAWQLATAFWPGPLTLVLEKKEIIPKIVTSGNETVAVRIPSHPIALELLHHLDFPLAAPSANPFGYISPTCSQHVKKQLGDKISLVVEGGICSKGIESTILGFDNFEPVLYRVGAISKEEIEAVIGTIQIKNKSTTLPQAPGMLSKHYAPKTRFVISTDLSKSIEENRNKKVGYLLFSNQNYGLNSKQFIQLSTENNLSEAAQKLYAAMHELDDQNLDLIVAERFPDIGIGISLNDRLQRAQETNF